MGNLKQVISAGIVHAIQETSIKDDLKGILKRAKQELVDPGVSNIAKSKPAKVVKNITGALSHGTKALTSDINVRKDYIAPTKQAWMKIKKKLKPEKRPKKVQTKVGNIEFGSPKPEKQPKEIQTKVGNIEFGSPKPEKRQSIWSKAGRLTRLKRDSSNRRKKAVHQSMSKLYSKQAKPNILRRK